MVAADLLQTAMRRTTRTSAQRQRRAGWEFGVSERACGSGANREQDQYTVPFDQAPYKNRDRSSGVGTRHVLRLPNQR